MGDGQILKIRQHSAAYANPTGFEEDLRKVLQEGWNKSKSGPVCGALIENGKRILLSYDGSLFTKHDISEVGDAALVNTASQEETFDRVQAKLNIFRTKLIEV